MLNKDEVGNAEGINHKQQAPNKEQNRKEIK